MQVTFTRSQTLGELSIGNSNHKGRLQREVIISTCIGDNKMANGILVCCKTKPCVSFCFCVLVCLLLISANRATAASSKCRDGPMCSFMASVGECEASPETMLIDCPKACRNPCLCDVSAVSNDTACDCIIRAKAEGYCNTSQASIECQTTCTNVTYESCPPLPVPADPNARLSTWSSHYNVTVTEVCIPGYLPLVERNQGKKLCSVRGQWVADYINGDPVECTGVDCGPPPSTVNTFFVATDTTFGSTVDYVCAIGCVPESGQRSLVCNTSALWEGQPLTCKRVECGFPPSSPNTTMAVTNTTLGGTATYTCVPGYTATHGDTSLYCNTSGVWHGSLVSCTVVDCNNPPSSANTQIQISGTTFNQSANYSCVPGFEYEQGQFLLICGPSGNWTGDVLECKIVDCGVPPSGVGLTVEVANTTFGQVASYSCRSGYTYSRGDYNLTCDLEGIWAGELMTCLASQTPSSTDTSDSSTDVLVPWVVGVTVFIAFVFIIISLVVIMNMEAFDKNKKLRKTVTTFREHVKSTFNFHLWITDSHKSNTNFGDRLSPHVHTTKPVVSSAQSLVAIQVKDGGNGHSMNKSSTIKVKDSGNFHSADTPGHVKSSFPPAFTNFLSPTSSSSLAKPPSTHSMPRSPSSITISTVSQSTTPEILPAVTS